MVYGGRTLQQIERDMNSTPVTRLVGVSFRFTVEEANSIISELDSLTQAGQFLPPVLEAIRRDINMQLSQPYEGGIASGA